jgi:hypothetical protein
LIVLFYCIVLYVLCCVVLHLLYRFIVLCCMCCVVLHLLYRFIVLCCTVLFERCVFARVPTSNPFLADLCYNLSFVYYQCCLESKKVTPNVEVISVRPTSLRA